MFTTPQHPQFKPAHLSRGIFAACLLLLTPVFGRSSHAWTFSSRHPVAAFMRMSCRSSLQKMAGSAQSDDENKPPYDYPHPRAIDESILGKLSGSGRPGAVIESAEQQAVKERILQELLSGQRRYDSKSSDGVMLDDYGELVQELEAEYDIDDPDAINAETLGDYTYVELQSKFDYEWNPRHDKVDPNFAALQQPPSKIFAQQCNGAG
jgi:hypothetical protein